MDVNGELRRDTVTKTVGMNLKYGLHAPSMETVMNMIPEAYVKRGQISAKGEVKVNGTLEGNYGNKQLPAISLNIKIMMHPPDMKDFLMVLIILRLILNRILI